MISIWNKKTGKQCSCDVNQLELMTGGEDAAYTQTAPKSNSKQESEASEDESGEEDSKASRRRRRNKED